MAYQHMPTSAMEVAEIAKRKEEEERIQREKELRKEMYDAQMRQLSQDALNESKKSNEIATKGLGIANDSRRLSRWAIGIAIASIIVSVILHFC